MKKLYQNRMNGSLVFAGIALASLMALPEKNASQLIVEKFADTKDMVFVPDRTVDKGDTIIFKADEAIERGSRSFVASYQGVDRNHDGEIQESELTAVVFSAHEFGKEHTTNTIYAVKSKDDHWSVRQVNLLDYQVQEEVRLILNVSREDAFQAVQEHMPKKQEMNLKFV